MIDDVFINKVEALKRCLARVKEEYNSDSSSLGNETKLDSIVLNLQRACETSIDIAMHTIRQNKLRIPQSSREAFEVLSDKGLLSEDLSQKMKNMVGFRNIAIHSYHKLDTKVVQMIVEQHLIDFQEYIEALKKTR